MNCFFLYWVFTSHQQRMWMYKSNAKQFFRLQIFKYFQFCMPRIEKHRDRFPFATHNPHCIFHAQVDIQKQKKNILVLCFAFIMQSFRRKRTRYTFELKWITFTWHRWRTCANRAYSECESNFEWIKQKEQAKCDTRCAKPNRLHTTVYTLHGKVKFPRAFIEHKIIKCFPICTRKNEEKCSTELENSTPTRISSEPRFHGSWISLGSTFIFLCVACYYSGPDLNGAHIDMRFGLRPIFL